MNVNELRTWLSTWLTAALDGRRTEPVSDIDLLELRDWIDGGCVGEAPMPSDPRVRRQ